MTRGVCTTMRELADAGKIIMCVIHQPSSQTFDLFTHLLLLAKGRIVYNGPMSTLQSYFARCVPRPLPAFLVPTSTPPIHPH